MIDVHEELEALRELGLLRRARLVSGPQGPRVVLNGRPVLGLCSGNALGFADHPRVREAAADAAMRWGVGAGAPRLASGAMTVHRRLEERLSGLLGTEAAVLFGAGALAAAGAVPALAGPGEVVFCDELAHGCLLDACVLSGAETVFYAHGDVEHLDWAIGRAEGRGALVVTEGVFALDGDVAPLAELLDAARSHGVRLLVDEGHALGAHGPGGSGAAAAAGLDGEVDVLVGTLGGSLGAAGGFAACDASLARYLLHAARPLADSTAPTPPAAAGALAALELLSEQPRRVEKLQANAEALRAELAREGFDVAGASGHVISLAIGDAALALRIAELALEDGVLCQVVLPPSVPAEAARLRLSVIASHTRSELREGARTIARAALRAGFRPGVAEPVAAAPARPSRFEALAGAAARFAGRREEVLERLPRAA